MKRTGKRVKFGATGHDLYLDLPLSNVVVGYRPENLIADMIFPIIDVPRQSGTIVEFSQADALRIPDTKRSPGTQAKIVTRDVSSIYFYCNNYALADGVTIEDRANADPVYANRLFTGKAQYLVDKLALDWENRVALQVTSTSNVGSSAAVSSVWTGTGATPLDDVNTAIDNVYYATGYRPNTVIMGPKAWHAFRRHSTIRDIINGTNNGGGFPNAQAVRDLLEVENVFVGGGFKNTAEENITKSLSSIWGSNVLVAYVNRQPTSRESPSFAYTHRWAASGIPNMQVERHPYDSRRKVDDIEVGYYQDEKVVGSAFGFLLTGATA